jgi:hypothetical protein
MSIQRRPIFYPRKRCSLVFILILIVFLLAAGMSRISSPDIYLMPSQYLQTKTDHNTSHQHPSHHEMMFPQYFNLATNESRAPLKRQEQNHRSDSLKSSNSKNNSMLQSEIELPQEPKVEATGPDMDDHNWTSKLSNGNATTTTLRQAIERPKKSSCWRRCPQGRTNSIVYGQFALAGLGDRLWMLSKLINLAGYLCATLHVPQPSGYLSPHHNNGKMLSKDLTWADLSNMTWNLESSDDDGEDYWDDFHNTQALRTIESRQTTWISLNETELQQEGIHTGRWILPGAENDTAPSNDHQKAPALFLTTNKRDGWNYFEQMDEFVRQRQRQQQQQPDDSNNNTQENFLWNLMFSLYYSDLCMSENPSKEWKSKKEKPSSFPQGGPYWSEDGCRYFQSRLPYHVKHIAESVWKEVEGSSLVVPNATTVGLLHIRRGDAQGQCM